MFGTAQPVLQPLDANWKEFAERSQQSVDAARIRRDVERLPAPRNRLHSPQAMDEADHVLIESFRAAGWMAERLAFELRNVRGYVDHAHRGSVAGSRRVIYPRLLGANVVALKSGTESSDLVVIGAHHDTIRDSPGADDNTASVAALLEVARLLQPYTFRHTIALVAFDMEELGMLGSREFVQMVSPARKVLGAIIFETMGYTSKEVNSQKIPRLMAKFYPEQTAAIRKRDYRGDWAAVLHRQSSSHIAQAFGAALTHVSGADAAILLRDICDLPLIGPLSRMLPFSGHFQRSDHLSFWRAGIPAIMVTDTADFRNPNYHRATDRADTLDYEHLAAISQATAVAVAELAGLKPRLTA